MSVPLPPQQPSATSPPPPPRPPPLDPSSSFSSKLTTPTTHQSPPQSPTRPTPTQTYSRLSGVGTHDFSPSPSTAPSELASHGEEDKGSPKVTGNGVAGNGTGGGEETGAAAGTGAGAGGEKRLLEGLAIDGAGAGGAGGNDGNALGLGNGAGVGGGIAGTTKKGVFAPFSVPRHRRLQTFAVITWAALLPICVGIFFFACSIPPFWPFVIAYLTWVLMLDKAPESGGRKSEWVRRWPLWTWFVGYFPVRLHKTADLPADRKYLFGYHPHGIIGMGAISNFATEATGFSELFPGLKPHLMTLATNFQLPLYRDLLLAMGIVSVSSRSCRNILRKGPGNAITIVIGGAAESLSAHPGTADLTLKRRMGFIKLAIREGADLVPVFSFGENDIFAQLQNSKGSRLYTVQKRFQQLFGFTLPIFHGRGIFNYVIGIMPYRHPIESVVGRPIRIEKVDNPTDEQLQEVQKKYIDELMRIWDEYKDEFAPHRTRELQLIA